MKLAFTTLACPGWTLEQAVAAARQYGYEGLELRLLDGELLRSDLDIEARRRVRELCTDAGIPIVCVDTSVRIAQPDPAARAEQVREGLAFLELAAGWDAPLIRVFGGPRTAPTKRRRAMRRSSAWRRWPSAGARWASPWRWRPTTPSP